MTTFNHLKWFTEIYPLNSPIQFSTSDGGTGESSYMGTVEFKAPCSNGTVTTMQVSRTLYCPTSPVNLLSSGAMREDGVVRDGLNDKLIHKITGHELAKIVWINGVAVLPCEPPPDLEKHKEVRQAVLASINYRTMHRRLMHASRDVVIQACKKAGIRIHGAYEKSFCEPCVMGKATDILGKEAPVVADEPLSYVRADLIYHKNSGHLGYHYSVHIVDVYSGLHWIKFCRTKDDAYTILKEWVKWIERQTDRKVKIIGLDGGPEFGQSTSEFQKSKLTTWAKGEGIQIFKTTPHTPWMNGKAERAGRNILDKSRTMMIAHGIPEHLWPFVLESVVNVLNLLPTTVNTDMASPYEVFAKGVNMPEDALKPYIRHLRSYFCHAYYYVKPEKRDKADKFIPRAKKGRLIGYGDIHGKIYWIWNPTENKIIRASAVRFNEGPDFNAKPDEQEPQYEVVFTDPTVDEIENGLGSGVRTEVNIHTSRNDVPKPTIPTCDIPTCDVQEHQPTGLLTPEATPGPDSHAFKIQLDAEDMADIAREAPIPPENPIANLTTQSESMRVGTRQSGRTRHEAGYYKKLATGKHSNQNCFHLVDSRLQEAIEYALSSLKIEHQMNNLRKIHVPKNFRQARKCPDYDIKWLPAMKQQYDSLEAEGVWTIVPMKPEMKVLPGKWVYDEKMDPSTGKFSARARWVVCGNYEDNSWSMQDVYAAVASSVSVKTFMALTATKDLECYQFDFKTAFLNAWIPSGTDYYVEQPHGLEKSIGKVCKLQKALYGLRRSPLYWFQAIMPTLKDLGFEPFNSDPCLFKHKKDGIYIILYVDDLLISAPTVDDINKIRDKLRNKYKLKEMGEVKRFLGFDVIRDRKAKTIFLSQEAYTRNLLEKFEYVDVTESQTPWPSNFELPTIWEPLVHETKAYIKKTGSLNWLSMGTRPDITYTVSRLCEANSGPSESHLTLLKHLFRYLKRTASLGIQFGGSDLTENDLRLRTYADASHADHLLTRHSTGGHVVFLAGGPVLWKSKRQTFVTLSSTEAEFTNLTPAALSTQWVAQILREAGCQQPTPMLLFTDSANARANVLNPLNTASTRCIDIRYKWIIENVQGGMFQLDHLAGNEMVADGLTKPLQKEKHKRFVRLLGLVSKTVPWNKAKDWGQR